MTLKEKLFMQVKEFQKRQSIGLQIVFLSKEKLCYCYMSMMFWELGHCIFVEKELAFICQEYCYLKHIRRYFAWCSTTNTYIFQYKYKQ